MKTKALVVLVAMGVLAGCASSQRPMTAEQQALVAEMQKAFIARMSAGTPQPFQREAAKPIQHAEPVNAMSEQELADRITAVGGGESSLEIRRVRDGLIVGGAAYLDPEGEITGFTANALTGDIVYSLKTGKNQITVKYLFSANLSEPVTLGFAVRNAENISFTSVTDKKLTGDDITLTSEGVLITRNTSAFHYKPGNPVTSVMAPDNYHVTAMQKGDFGSTGYLLLEKNEGETKGIAGLTNLMGSLGETVGLSEADGYMLWNAQTGDVVKLDISTDDKDVSVGRGCTRQNDLVNKCTSFDSYESLYRQDGTRNRGHYFWRVDWMTSPQGPYAVVQEAGSRKINVIDLQHNERVTVLERTLGIGSHDVTQAANGTIRIEAQMGFSKEVVNDAVVAYSTGMQKLATAD
ncbi:hypothetical protein MIH18_07485 [Marinobacter sp. M3C]|jgi:hypothetical protein|uniref:hypothetical protein n=2 Tax=unclassified Marinobacter TaxID=83889 RepID=UPI00200C40BC|nr:hypothetical protein [Marinobacter sp. M3C]UQG61768.1 hypothetical protein MIH18_07485 [Marinobacter sp. M3C]